MSESAVAEKRSHRIHVRLDTPTQAWLGKQAKAHHCSIGALISEAIETELGFHLTSAEKSAPAAKAPARQHYGPGQIKMSSDFILRTTDNVMRCLVREMKATGYPISTIAARCITTYRCGKPPALPPPPSRGLRLCLALLSPNPPRSTPADEAIK